MIELLQDMGERLRGAAQEAGYDVSPWPDLAKKSFRGSNEEQEFTAKLPYLLGLRIGPYPIIASVVELEDEANVLLQHQRLLKQAVIARSYLPQAKMVDLHLLLVTHETPRAVNLCELIERDESVCRKLVWIAPTEGRDNSFNLFIARTFMARPWRRVQKELIGPLDQNTALVQRALISEGLSPQIAGAWVEICASESDPVERVRKMIQAMEATP